MVKTLTPQGSQPIKPISVQTQPSTQPSNFLSVLFQDIINFIGAIFGRSPIMQSSAAVSQPAQQPISTTSAVPVVPPTPPVPKKSTISASAAIAQAISTETKLNPRDFAGSGWYQASNQQFQKETINGEIVFGWNPNTTCGGQSSPGLTLQQASSAGIGATGVATGVLAHAGVIGAGLSTGIGLATAGAGLVVGIIIAIFQHHAQNVARDNRAQCIIIPAVNNAFKVLIQGVMDGQIKPSDAIVGLQEIPNQFLSIAGAAKNNSPYCNALCEELIRTRAIVYYWTSQFQAME
jgi:hypothetical protein